MFLVLIILALPHIAQAVVIDGETIMNLISDHVEKNMPWSAGSVRLDFPAKAADAFIPAEDVAFEVKNRPGEDYIGDTAFTVIFLSGGAILKEETVQVRLEVLTNVVVAAKTLTRNKEISAEDVKVQKKWLKRILPNAVTTPAEVIGKVPALNIIQNSEITRNMIKTPFLIKKGKLVRIVLDNVNFNITAMGVSEEDGECEKVIRVRNLSSKKIIYARVTGDSLVKVEYY
jgi:flagellar basal body P-ring formation protein FlgA